MMVLLAVGFMGLSVHASATPEVMTAAAAATEVVEADIDLGESLMKFVEQSGISGIIADWRVLVMLIISCVLLYLAIVKQYERLFAMDGVELRFEDEVLDYIVQKADEYKLGARGLRSICEAIMIDAMYEVPSSGETQYVVTLPYAQKKLENSNFLELKQVG